MEGLTILPFRLALSLPPCSCHLLYTTSANEVLLPPSSFPSPPAPPLLPPSSFSMGLFYLALPCPAPPPPSCLPIAPHEGALARPQVVPSVCHLPAPAPAPTPPLGSSHTHPTLGPGPGDPGPPIARPAPALPKPRHNAAVPSFRSNSNNTRTRCGCRPARVSTPEAGQSPNGPLRSPHPVPLLPPPPRRRLPAPWSSCAHEPVCSRGGRPALRAR